MGRRQKWSCNLKDLGHPSDILCLKDPKAFPFSSGCHIACDGGIGVGDPKGGRVSVRVNHSTFACPHAQVAPHDGAPLHTILHEVAVTVGVEGKVVLNQASHGAMTGHTALKRTRINLA